MHTTATSKLTFAISFLGLAAFALPGYAATAPGIQIHDDGGRVITIDSAGAVTTSGTCTVTTCTTTASTGLQNTNGQVSWAGVIGNFSFTATGQTAPLRPGIQDINISSLFTGAAGGTLTVLFTVTNIDGSGPYTMNQTTSFLAGIGVATYTSFADPTNTPYGTGSTLGVIGSIISSLASNLLGLTGPASHAMSVTDQVVLTVGGGAFFSTDFYTMNSSNPPLQVSCSAGSGVAGIAYNSLLVANGGVPSYVYSVTGSLPPGLALNPTSGAITGTPSAQGTYPYTAKVTDSSGSSSSTSVTSGCSITINPPATPLSLVCSASTGQVGTLYNSNLIATGGTGKGYMYSITVGTLPPVLSLNPTTGFITGTPTTAGPFNFTAKVTDTGDSTLAPVTSNCGITVASPPLPSLVCSTVNSGNVGTAFSSPALSVTGGSTPYTFSVATGTLPGGLTLNTSTGAITGTPTGPGSFTIKVTDKLGAVAATTCPYTISNAVIIPPLSLLCAGGTGTVGSAYSSTLAVTGGVGPYTYSISAGALPGGLTLNSSTGAITGSPTGAGTFGYTAKVVDGKGTIAYSNCTGSCSAGTPLSWNLISKLGNLGNSYSWTSGGVTLTAYGFNNNGTPTALYAKNQSSTESGLGIASDVDFEINTYTFIQLDVSQLVAAGVTNAQISFNSVQSGESWDVYGSNTLGTLGTLISGPGTLAGTLIAMPGYGTYKYIGIRAGAANIDIAAVASTVSTLCSITVAPAPVPKLTMTKSAGATKVNPFQPVTYTYKVTNAGTTTVTNIVVTDDNATPGYAADDFTVGTIASLAPGATATLTATVIPPVTEGGNQVSNNWWGYWEQNFDYTNATPAGTLICKQLSNGHVQMTWRQDPSMNDNTYGANSSSGWGQYGHSFSDMLGNNNAEFQFLDKNGNVRLDMQTDYISQSSHYPSGYGTGGVNARNCGVYSGDPSKVMNVDSTLSHCLNQSPSFYQCTKDSSTASGWDNVVGYSVEVDGSIFGSAGFGGVAIPQCQSSPTKSGNSGGDDGWGGWGGWGSNNKTWSKPMSSTSKNTATATGTSNGASVSATASATVQIDASPQGWSQCGKY